MRHTLFVSETTNPAGLGANAFNAHAAPLLSMVANTGGMLWSDASTPRTDAPVRFRWASGWTTFGAVGHTGADFITEVR